MYIIGNTIKSASEFEVYFLTKAQTKFSLSEKSIWYAVLKVHTFIWPDGSVG